jgi:ABC-type multidrug transport system fused ATPase/permease subunit
MLRQAAEVENNMNSVERIVHYATEIEQESPKELPDSEVPSGWPCEGRIELEDIVLRYRPELPEVLKGVSMSVKSGEKIGIIGRYVYPAALNYSTLISLIRTGAGKSSIVTALYRLVELSSGRITIDGIDISKIGLTDLRSGIAIIPQDPLLCKETTISLGRR